MRQIIDKLTARHDDRITDTVHKVQFFCSFFCGVNNRIVSRILVAMDYVFTTLACQGPL